MLDRWWPMLFLIGLSLLATAWPFYSDLYTPHRRLAVGEPWP